MVWFLEKKTDIIIIIIVFLFIFLLWIFGQINGLCQIRFIATVARIF